MNKIINIIFFCVVFIGVIYFIFFIFKNQIIRRNKKQKYFYTIRFTLTNNEVTDVNLKVDCEFNNVKSLIYVSNLIEEKRNKYLIKEGGNEKYIFKNELRSIELIEERNRYS